MSTVVPPARRAPLTALAIALVVAAVYLPTVRFGFVWDDTALVAPNPALESAAGLARAFRRDLYRAADPTLEATPYHRPTVLVSWWVNTRLPAAAPAALHAGNALLHALAAALLFLLLARATGGRVGVAAALALWWALHPLCVEPVAWISGRYDLMGGLFAVGLLLTPATGWRSAVARALLLALGLGSKESFVVLPAVLALRDWSDGLRLRAALPGWLAMGAAGLGWLGMRSALGVGAPPGQALTAAGFLGTVLTYLGRAFAPLPLSTGTPWTRPGWAALLTAGALVIAATVTAVRRRSLAAPLALTLLPLVPTSAAVAEFGVVADRYAYLPLIGLAWLAATVVGMLAPERLLVSRGAVAVFGLLAVLGGASASLRLPDWRDDRSLFGAALRVDSGDWMAHLSLGRLAIAEGDLEGAIAHLQAARERNPRSGLVANALADAHHRRGDGAAMLEAARAAVALAPDLPQARLRLAIALRLVGERAAARAELDRMSVLWPDWGWPTFLREVERCEVEPRPACAAGLERIARSAAPEAPFALEALALDALSHGDPVAAARLAARLGTLRPDHSGLRELEERIAAALPSSGASGAPEAPALERAATRSAPSATPPGPTSSE